MLHKPDISNWMLLAAGLGLTLFCEPVNAGRRVVYLQQLPVLGGKQPTYQIPSVSPGVGGGNYGPFNLPGYGMVYVNLGCPSTNSNCQLPQLTWAHNQAVENQSTSGGAYSWGNDTNALSLYNPTGNTENYTLAFYFTGINIPSPANLVLVVAGLKVGTTATVSGTAGSGAAKLSNGNGGEYNIPTDSKSWCWPGCLSSAPTVFPGNSGTLTFSSGNTGGSTDSRNTGWDVYQPNSPGLRVLSLDVKHASGDGMGFTLGYRVCNTLVGNSLDSFIFNGAVRHLYDINTANGAATNSRQIGAAWSLAFSPISPNGTLYAISQNFGWPTGNTLFTVNPATGASTPVPTTSFNLVDGALAADPTTGILYGVDGAGNLFSIVSGVVTPVGKVTGTYSMGYQKFGAMAFDKSGNLFLVDSGLYLVKVPAPVQTNFAAATRIILTPYSNQPGFALAIDPASGTAYYAYGGSLYTLNLTAGTLSLVGPLTGAEDHGLLSSLTFVTSAPDQYGACPPDNIGPPLSLSLF